MEITVMGSRFSLYCSSSSNGDSGGSHGNGEQVLTLMQ